MGRPKKRIGTTGRKNKPGGGGWNRSRISSPELDAAIEECLATGESPEAVAPRHGVKSGTLRKRIAERRAQGAQGGALAAGTAQSPSPSPVVDSGAAGAPVTGTDSHHPERLRAIALCRRILLARNPAALAELDAGLVEAAKGEAALDAWCARPQVVGEKVDPIDALGRALDAATSHAAGLPPLHPRVSPLLQTVAKLSAQLESVAQKRPRAPTPDEVHERLRVAMGECTEHLLRHTREAATTLRRQRAALFEGLDLRASERAAIEQRVDAMMGSA